MTSNEAQQISQRAGSTGAPLGIPRDNAQDDAAAEEAADPSSAGGEAESIEACDLAPDQRGLPAWLWAGLLIAASLALLWALTSDSGVPI